MAACVSRFFAHRRASRSEASVREEVRHAPSLDRVIAILHLAATLILLAAFSPAAHATAQIENRISGLRSGSNNLVGIEPRLSEEAVREKVALAYELASGDAVAARAAAPASEAFSYTFSKYLSSITKNGLRQGSYATRSGTLSPLQAQIELALPANRGLPDALVRIDLAGMRAAGYEIPGVTRVSSRFGLPGGGYEMQFPYPIPPQFLTVVP